MVFIKITGIDRNTDSNSGQNKAKKTLALTEKSVCKCELVMEGAPSMVRPSCSGLLFPMKT